MENNNDKTILEGLRYALDNQIKWQHYAEAKNLCLLTISGATLALMFSSLQNIPEKESLENAVERLIFSKSPYMLAFILTTVTSLILSIISFWIRLKDDERHGLEKRFFISWRYMVSFNKEKLLENINSYDEKTQIKDVFYQQYLGSKITLSKYRYFNWGISIYLSGILILLSNLIYIHFLK